MQKPAENALTHRRIVEIVVSNSGGGYGATIRVQWKHFQYQLHTWGVGVVFCEVFFRDTVLSRRHTGYAWCSRKDTWNGAKGEKVAFRRAVAKYDRELRSQLWAGYNADRAAAVTRTAANTVSFTTFPAGLPATDWESLWHRAKVAFLDSRQGYTGFEVVTKMLELERFARGPR